ncbi:FAD-binding domain-containing protein, partial [Conidiobolus coronatus NRRL 28638]
MLFYNFLYYILFSSLVDCYTYTSYQYKIECESSSPILYPKTLEKLQDIIKNAIRSGDKIKVVGSRHSITDAICTDGIPIHMKHFDEVSVNKREGTVTLGAGLEIMDAMDRLMEFGVTVNNLPSFGGITVAGCVAIGVHGSSLKTPSNPSEYLTAVTFINGNGELETVDETDPDFNSFRVNLGLLGVFVSLTFKSTPLYKMKMENYRLGEELLTKTPD